MRPQTIVERLDFVAKRIPGLKFTPPTQLKPGDDQGYGCFMSCDMYYIEIKVDQSHQTVKDVVISHGNNADGISCAVLRKVLADQDFETFAKHLTGLHSIYQISTNDKKVKQRAYPALTALETDLKILYDHQRRRTNNCHDLIHKSPIGIMEPRKGGLPVRLTHFITPYDLVDTTHKGLINLTINNIIDKNLGLSATVEIEGSSPHKLQVKSLISTQVNSSLPAYAPFNSQNSEKLPAQFVLKLSQPFPMLNTSINQIVNEINEPATIKEYLTTISTNSKESLISLIARQELDLNKGPFCRSVDVLKGADSDSCDLRKHVYTIKLLDQYHTYHILDSYLERQDGVYVTKIPFTHPTSIPIILRVLRQQALFNFVIGSCIRRNKSTTNTNSNNNNNIFDDSTSKVSYESNIFDIIPVNLNNICVSFEHPSKESLATLEIDFKELSCQLYALDRESVCSNEFATKVLQKCWSIPITLRSVLKKCDERRLALLEDANKRRERELQELLTSNTAQQGLQFKPHLQYQETLLQSKFNTLSEKSNPRDLNSIAEFLYTKVSNASTSDSSNQANNNTDGAGNKSNLLKKFSCKPKIKQITAVASKNQTGNKILSLMLKRQNSTSSSADDANLKATSTKKAKTKSRESSDQFAIKRGSLGSLKLTVTKSKPTTASSSSTSVFASTSTTTSSSTSSSSTLSAPSATALMSSSASTSTSSSSAATALSSVPTNSDHKPAISKSSDTNKILGLGSSTPSIKYTIPKISKTQQASQSGSNNQANSTDNHNSTINDSSSQGDDSSRPSSSANSSSAPSSTTTNKRVTSTPFNRTNNSNRNPVSSSTHPLVRTTSNPLASTSRPSSTSANENHLPNRISSSGNCQIKVWAKNGPNLTQSSQPQLQLQQQPQQQPRPIVPTFGPVRTFGFTPNSNLIVTPAPMSSLAPAPVLAPTLIPVAPQSITPAQIPINVPTPTSAPAATPALNPAVQLRHLPPTICLTGNMRDPRSDSQWQFNRAIQPEVPPAETTLTHSMTHCSSSTNPSQKFAQPVNQAGVSSSSDSGSQDPGPTISTPSSPTECSQIETVAPPPLIPIDSLDEHQAPSPDTDHPDDASDRLSIVDTNESVADSNSVAGTPKPSGVSSPMNAQDSNSAIASSSSRTVDSIAVSSINNGPSSVSATTISLATTSVAAPVPAIIAESNAAASSLATIALTAQSPPASTTGEGAAVFPQPSLAPSEDGLGLDLRPPQPTSSLTPSEESIAHQSTMAATTSDMI